MKNLITILQAILIIGVITYFWFPQYLPFDLRKTPESLTENTTEIPTQSPSTKKISTKITPARDLSGGWSGVAPQGATYRDNVSNPACRYEADLFFDLKQNGNSISGSVRFVVRKVEQLLSAPCLATVGTTFSFPVNGSVSGTDINFSHLGVSGSLSPTNFIGKFTNDIMSGTFERNSYPGGDLTGLQGEWIVNRNR